MNLIIPDNARLRELEQLFDINHGSLRVPKIENRLLLNGQELSHEIHFDLRLLWRGFRLRIWSLEVPLSEVRFGTVSNLTVGDYYGVGIVEPGRTSVLGRFRLDKTVRRTKPGSKTEVYAQYQLSRRWYK